MEKKKKTSSNLSPVHIDKKVHKKLKLYCAANNVSLRKATEEALIFKLKLGH